MAIAHGACSGGALKPTKQNQMKKIIAVTAMVMVASAGLWAQEPAAIGLTVDATYASKNIFRGVVLGEHAFHPSAEIS